MDPTARAMATLKTVNVSEDISSQARYFDGLETLQYEVRYVEQINSTINACASVYL
jgi:hypothetical protein